MAFYECDLLVKRDGEYKTLKSGDLVPGDIIQIPSFKKMPCDCVLLTGMAAMNESMLTGESVPVLKSPVQGEGLDKRNILYSGTEVI